jgi:hypothetical protein
MVTIKRTHQIGLSLILSLALVIPAFAQSGENNDWQAIVDQGDARRKAELLEKFINDYSRSGRRPDADFQLLDFYLQNKDNAKIIQHAEKYRQSPPSADNAAKAKVFTQAMVAAATINNVQRTVEYADYALQAEPTNLVVLGFLAGNNLPNPAKALEYAEKAIAVPKPATMREEPAQKANEELIAAMAATPVNTAAKDAAQARVDAASKDALARRDEAVEALGKAIAIGGQFVPQAKPLLDSLFKGKTGSLDGEDQFIAQKKTELGI